MSACSLFSDPFHKRPPPAPVVEEPPKPTALPPVATHQFEFDPQHDDVVGLIQTTVVAADDTLPDIARRFNLGYEEILRANPGVDPWLPGEGREIVLPTQFVLPNAPREGVVINIPAMRLFYFPARKKGEPPGQKAVVITHPIGIGKIGWATPEGTTKILKRTKDPIWRVPVSVRKEHEENGDPVPAVVQPGPDNPLGAYAFTLGWPSYLIHGTNKPYGVGMRSSHGCIRLYPEDIELLYESVPIGTKVHVVNQPFLFGRAAEGLVFQPYGMLEDDKRDWQKSHRKLLDKTLSTPIRTALKERKQEIDWARVEALVAQSRGVPVPIVAQTVGPGAQPATVDEVLLAARKVQNVLPEGATWDGQVQLDAQKFQDLVTESERPSEQAESREEAGKRGGSGTSH